MDKIENNDDNDETEDNEKFGPLQAFHGVGTRGLFYYLAEHRDGLGVRLSGCHCPFCMRGYRKNGMGSMPSGCLSDEPSEYIVCKRQDEEWTKQTKILISRLVTSLQGKVQQGDTIAIANNSTLKGAVNCVYFSYDIAKVLLVQDTGFSISVFIRQPNSSVYLIRSPEKIISILYTSLRYIIPDACITSDLCITLDSTTVGNIVKNCFNGV